MQNIPIYEALARAFAADGVDTHFTLMGDGNMHWAAAMKNLEGMNSYPDLRPQRRRLRRGDSQIPRRWPRR